MKHIGLRGFYFITDSELTPTPVEKQVMEALKGGARIIQYREKNLHKEEMIDVARSLKEICEGKAVFIVNDSVEVAYECDADGVHLGQQDTSLKEARDVLGEEKIIGVTVHNVEEAVRAQNRGADYVTASPIYGTSTKKDAGQPAGIKLIKDIKSRLEIPVGAIGGINRDNIDEVLGARADMASAISATVSRPDISASVNYYAEKFHR